MISASPFFVCFVYFVVHFICRFEGERHATVLPANDQSGAGQQSFS
jgi:hypothetical protein